MLTVKADILIPEDQKQIQAWQAPTATAKAVSPTSSPHDGVKQAAIQKKLDTIIIPKVDFDSPNLYEAIDFMRLRCAEGDFGYD